MAEMTEFGVAVMTRSADGVFTATAVCPTCHQIREHVFERGIENRIPGVQFGWICSDDEGNVRAFGATFMFREADPIATEDIEEMEVRPYLNLGDGVQIPEIPPSKVRMN